MKLTIEPTPAIVDIDGQPCRLWTGEDENGTFVHVFVRALSPQTHDEGRLEAYERELLTLPAPRDSGLELLLPELRRR